MNPGPSTPTLDAQWLTPAKLAWVLDVEERTLRDWDRKNRFPYMKIGGQIKRYDPAGVMRILLRHYHAAIEDSSPISALPDQTWQRIERLIKATIESQLSQPLEAA